MPDKRFDQVRERLLWAKKIHIDKGLIGREGKGTMRQLIEFYRSDQWRMLGQFGDVPPDALRVVNKIFPIANRQQAGVAARNPKVQYFPRGSEEDKTRATHVEALHNYDIREQDHIIQFNAALRDAQFASFPGIVRHGYTPEEELLDEKGRALQYYRPANPNRPWLRRIAPWNCLIDPRAENFTMDGGARWCAFRSVMTIDEIKRNPNMIAREKLKDFRGNIGGPWLDMMPDHLKAREDPDLKSYVEVWTVYDLEDRTWFQLTLDGVDDWLRSPDEWPIPWEWLPISTFVVNHQMDTPYPKSLMEDLLPLQMELNQVRTMMSLLTRNIRRINLFDRNKLDDSTQTLVKDAALVENFLITGNPSEAVSQFQVGGLPQELLQYVAQIVDDMRESVGLSLFARARRENVESAQEAAQIAQGQDIIEDRTQDAFDRFMRHAEALFMQGRRTILAKTGESEVVRILGQEGATTIEEYPTVDAETLAGEYEFHIEAGSSRPRDKDREAQLAGADLGLAAQFGSIFRLDQFARRYVEKRGLDPARYMQRDSQQAAVAQGAGQLGRELGERGGNNSIDANTLALLTGGIQ